MWIDEVKESPLVKEIIEIAGKERIAEQSRRTLTKLLVAHATKLKLNPPDDAEALLLNYASEDELFEMANDMENMDDFNDFLKSHNMESPGCTG